MKVLQLIDSLHAGGAERVAVNYANGLVPLIDKSYLCATRAEGILKDSIADDVGYLFLNKKKTLDFASIRRLLSFIKEHKIDVIHAHSSSFFLATLIKLQHKKTKIVWHDHYGNSEFLDKRPARILKRCSRSFSHIFSVNQLLHDWARIHLKAKNTSYLPNFAVQNEVSPSTRLNGESDKRIICLANLRPQKDHFNLVKGFTKVHAVHPDWTLHLVGKDFEDNYASTLKAKIKTLKLNKNVYLYNSRPDIPNILRQCDIGVLSSKSEGLPVALLEYGLAKLPVVVTNVGECSQVIESDDVGFLVDAENGESLGEAMIALIENKALRLNMGNNFKNKIEAEYSSTSILSRVHDIYYELLSPKA